MKKCRGLDALIAKKNLTIKSIHHFLLLILPTRHWFFFAVEFNVENNMFTRIDSNLRRQSVWEGGEMIEFKAECDICNIDPFCKNKCAEPTNKPTSAPTRAPTKEPTEEPTEAPTPWTTDEPTPNPSDKITNEIVGL